MKILNILFWVVIALVLLKVDITLKPFRISWNPPFLYLFGILFIIIGWTMTSYQYVKERKKEIYLDGYSDALKEVLDDIHAKQNDNAKNDSCAHQMDSKL